MKPIRREIGFLAYWRVQAYRRARLGMDALTCGDAWRQWRAEPMLARWRANSATAAFYARYRKD